MTTMTKNANNSSNSNSRTANLIAEAKKNHRIWKSPHFVTLTARVMNKLKRSPKPVSNQQLTELVLSYVTQQLAGPGRNWKPAQRRSLLKAAAYVQFNMQFAIRRDRIKKANLLTKTDGMRQLAIEFVREMMPLEGISATGLDSSAYKDMLSDYECRYGADIEALDQAVRNVITEIGEVGFEMFD